MTATLSQRVVTSAIGVVVAVGLAGHACLRCASEAIYQMELERPTIEQVLADPVARQFALEDAVIPLPSAFGLEGQVIFEYEVPLRGDATEYFRALEAGLDPNWSCEIVSASARRYKGKAGGRYAEVTVSFEGTTSVAHVVVVR